MTNKSILIGLALLFAALAWAPHGCAQDRIVVSLPQGGFASFVNRSEWTEPRPVNRANELPAPLASQALPDTNQIVHRILRDRDGAFVFGYDLWILSDRTTKQFKVAIKPLDARLEASLRPDTPAAEATLTFPKSTEA